MKYIDFYKTQKISEKDAFQGFIGTLKPSIKNWEYFVNWNKVNKNLQSLDKELDSLNKLFQSKDLKKDFIKLVSDNPSIIKTLPVLLAVRENKTIIIDYTSKNVELFELDFSKTQKLSSSELEKYYTYFEKTGLINIFKNNKITNIKDYAYGIEVGLDSNGRKNRGGTLMENTVEVFIKKVTTENKNLEYIPQATATAIKQKWNYTVKFEKSQRSFDFAIYNKQTKKLTLIETNFYNGGGSKLKAVCGEFKDLFQELKRQNIEFVWITDGEGWHTTKRPLEEVYNSTNHIFNIHMLEQGILKDIL